MMYQDDKNNNCAKSFDAITIRNQCDDEKLKFIRNVLARTEISETFPMDLKINRRKIFYRIKDGTEEKREWVLFENNKFYCLYCVCFSLQKNQFVLGVEYKKGCRLSDNLKKHDDAAYHNLATNAYLKFDPNLQQEVHEYVYESSKRNVLRIIVKIIIYIATHGKK